jgi:hypothetical protein
LAKSSGGSSPLWLQHTKETCGDDPHEDLAKFGYKLNMNVIFLKHPSMLLATLLEP